MKKIVLSLPIKNNIQYQKQENQSQFRVHFYLRNVYYSSEKRLQNFLEETSNKISELVPVSTIQIYGSIKKYVEISVGLKTDQLAFLFWQSNQKIHLPGQNNHLIGFQPFFSQAFRGFCQKKKYGNEVITQQPQQIPKKIERQQSKAKSQSKDYQHEMKKLKLQESKSKRSQVEPMRFTVLYVFGIPLEYKDKDVAYLLTNYKLKIQYTQWKMRQDVQVLYLELYESISENQLLNLDISIDRYPLLITAKYSKSDTITDLYHRHQLEVNFEKNIDEIQFIKFCSKIGSIVSIVKDQFYGPFKYVVSFSNLAKMKRFQIQFEHHYRSVKICKPKFPLRMCRVQRNFTFPAFMDNLHFYEREMEKNNQSASKNIDY